MAEVRFTATAEAALIAIIDHIAAENPAAALALVEDLERRVTATLGTFPDGGAPFRGPLRLFALRGHSVIYRHDATAGVVHVLDVFGAGEDWR